MQVVREFLGHRDVVHATDKETLRLQQDSLSEDFKLVEQLLGQWPDPEAWRAVWAVYE